MKNIVNNTIEHAKNKILYSIRDMPMDEFCTRVNVLARATRYCTDDDNVCELLDTLDTKSTVKVVHLDPDYFGSETAYIVIDDPIDNDFKELFIQGMLSRWNNLNTDEKIDYINNFIN